MQVHIGINNESDANDFLSSLWAEIEKEFGKCQWRELSLKKNKTEKTIYFGNLYIANSSLDVSIGYKNNGSITQIFFEYQDKSQQLEKDSNLGQRITQTIKKARKNAGNYEKFYVRRDIKSLLPLANYKGSNFVTRVSKNGDTCVIFPLYGYTRNHIAGDIYPKAELIMDFLSIETNAPFWRDPWVYHGEQSLGIPSKEIYQISDCENQLSYKDGRLIISEIGKHFIDYVVSLRELDDELSLFFKACSHFHTARKYDNQFFFYNGTTPLRNQEFLANTNEEIATTMYLSALEVLTLIGFKEEKCKECGQPKFNISKRIKNLSEKYLGVNLANDFINYYDKRSKYLHRGELLSQESFSTNLFPQLDKKESSGCKTIKSVRLYDIRKFTGYILRTFYKEYFAEHFLKHEIKNKEN